MGSGVAADSTASGCGAARTWERSLCAPGGSSGALLMFYRPGRAVQPASGGVPVWLFCLLLASGLAYCLSHDLDILLRQVGSHDVPMLFVEVNSFLKPFRCLHGILLYSTKVTDIGILVRHVQLVGALIV